MNMKQAHIQNSGFFKPTAELMTREARLNPYPFYADMRENSPIRYNEARHSWDVFLYEDVHRILQDHDTFSSRRPNTGITTLMNTIINLDPPKHTQLRNLINKAFTPKAIADMAPRIAEISHELLDQLPPSGEMDLVHDFSAPLPVIVIAEMLGVPKEDRLKFKDWSDSAVTSAEDQSEEAVQRVFAERVQSMQELTVYFKEILDQRRKVRQPDLISLLIDAEIDGRHLTEEELIGFCILLLIAGNETTTNLISNATRCLIEMPHLQEQITSQPELIPSFIEEVLRYLSPVQAIFRTVAKDTVVCGQELKAGENVVVWLGSANRDARKFDRPDEFVIDRSPNAHLTFGFGVHFCLGAPLARLEAQVAMPLLFDRLRHLQYTDRQIEPIRSSVVFGLKTMPIRYEGGKA